MSADAPGGEIAVRHFFDTLLSSLLDPNPVAFRASNERGVRPLRRLLDRPTDEAQALPRAMARNDVLCACLDFTEHEAVEHLIVGYGSKHGGGTRVTHVQHLIGAAGSVAIPPSMAHAISDHALTVTRSEILVFHNHPRNWVNVICDNLPIASGMDRETLLKSRYLSPLHAIPMLTRTGGLRFYLGENGFVREYRTPRLLRLVDLVISLQKETPTR